MAAGVHGRAALDALRLQGDAGGLDVVGVGDKMHQTRLDRHCGLQRRIVHVKPALAACIGRPFGSRVDRDDFKIGQRVAGRGNFEQAVVGAVLRVLAAGRGGDAERGFAPLHALRQGLGHDDQMINLCFHGPTIPLTDSAPGPPDFGIS